MLVVQASEEAIKDETCLGFNDQMHGAVFQQTVPRTIGPWLSKAARSAQVVLPITS
jgi:hypothetical protein